MRYFLDNYLRGVNRREEWFDQPAFAMCVTAEEKERISLASHNWQKITSYNFRIYNA
jgi:hypothetical protein